MSDLLSLQRRLYRALCNDTEALESLGPAAARRLAVHRTTITAGLGQILANVFPTLRRVVGLPTFTTLVSDFVSAALPRHPVLSAYGGDFPAFLAIQPIAHALPYIADLARVEWARQDSFFAANAPTFDLGALTINDINAASTLRLRLHPATRIVGSPFPVHRIWRLNQSDVETKDIPVVDMSVGEHVIVTRPGDEVVTRVISQADAILVQVLGSGACLEAAAAAACASASDFDLMPALAGHFRNGTFAG